MEKLTLYNYFNNDELNKLHKKISGVIALQRLEVDKSSEEIAMEILNVIFNKKN